MDCIVDKRGLTSRAQLLRTPEPRLSRHATCLGQAILHEHSYRQVTAASHVAIGRRGAIMLSLGFGGSSSQDARCRRSSERP